MEIFGNIYIITNKHNSKHKKFLTKSLTMPEKLQLAIDYLSLQRSPAGEINAFR